MFWNGIFWAFFAAAEAAMVGFLALHFSAAGMAGGAFILLLGAWKLAEDRAARGIASRPREILVRRSLLNKLKQPVQ